METFSLIRFLGLDQVREKKNHPYINHKLGMFVLQNELQIAVSNYIMLINSKKLINPYKGKLVLQI